MPRKFHTAVICDLVKLIWSIDHFFQPPEFEPTCLAVNVCVSRLAVTIISVNLINTRFPPLKQGLLEHSSNLMKK